MHAVKLVDDHTAIVLYIQRYKPEDLIYSFIHNMYSITIQFKS